MPIIILSHYPLGFGWGITEGNWHRTFTPLWAFNSKTTLLCLRVCVCVCVWASIVKWLGHQPVNRKVAGSIPGQATLVLLLFPWARNFTHIAPVYPAVKWRPGGLGKQLFNCYPCLLKHVVLVGLRVPKPSSRTWYSPTCGVLGGFTSTSSERLSSAQAPQSL